MASTTKKTIAITTKENNIEGVTKNGFHFVIPRENLDDMEIIDAINEADENPARIAKVAELLLGKEQKKALYDHYRNKETGKVPASVTIEAIMEILSSCNETKK